MTINEAMVLMKSVRERMNDLKQVRNSSTTKQRNFYRDRSEETVVEPQYDLKVVDRRITELQNWLYLAEAKIKQANASTKIDLTSDVEKLLAPLD